MSFEKLSFGGNVCRAFHKELQSAYWRENHVGIQLQKVQIGHLYLDTHVIARRLHDK